MSDTQDTLIERLKQRAAFRAAMIRLDKVAFYERSDAELDTEAATALADRDAKIAELTDISHELSEASRKHHGRAHALEAQVAELMQKLERATALVAKFVRCNDEGPGLIDCIDNDGERYTSQFLSDTVREARALNSGASQNG